MSHLLSNVLCCESSTCCRYRPRCLLPKHLAPTRWWPRRTSIYASMPFVVSLFSLSASLPSHLIQTAHYVIYLWNTPQRYKKDPVSLPVVATYLHSTTAVLSKHCDASSRYPRVQSSDIMDDLRGDNELCECTNE